MKYSSASSELMKTHLVSSRVSSTFLTFEENSLGSGLQTSEAGAGADGEDRKREGERERKEAH